MKVIIAGGRNIKPSFEMMSKIINESGFAITMLVQGDAQGVDFAASVWARKTTRPMTVFPPNWNLHGRTAGPIRNREMAEFSHALILIWDGKSRGSASMKREAEKAEISIYEHIWKGEDL